MFKIVAASIIGLACGIILCCPVMAEEAVVTSEELIQQLQKKPRTRKTRGIIVTGKESENTHQQHSLPSATIYVHFISGTVEFADEHSKIQLDELGRALTSKSLETARFEISGHTDSVGSHADNMALSKRRAETVKSYMEDNFGHSKSSTVGYGETRPIASNDTEEGRAKNRRVVITTMD